MGFPTAPLSLSEQCRQVVVMTAGDALSATYACALATSPLVPQQSRVIVWEVASTPTHGGAAESQEHAQDAAASSSASHSATQAVEQPRAPVPSTESLRFSKAVKAIVARMCESRAPRPTATVTHMTQFFYGGVSPKLEEVAGMVQRVELRHGAAADVTAALASGRLSVDGSVFMVVLNAQSLGTDDAEAALKPYEVALRALWRAEGTAVSTAEKPTGSLIILADATYRRPACAMLKAIAAEVSTPISWWVQLAYVTAMDPPALEFGAAAAAVESRTGLSHGGTLPVLCAANALGVLRHFPVSRSEPATITPVDVALNAAMLGLIFLRRGQLPECSDSLSELTPPAASAGEAAPKAAAVRHHMASFAVAESRKPAETSLVWGMVGEYLMSYYGRFAQHIQTAFPVSGIVTANPVLQFPFSVKDVLNFGPEPRCPTYLLEGYRAYQQRQSVTSEVHGAAVTRAMQTCVGQLDDTLAAITRCARAGELAAKNVASTKVASPGKKRASATSSFALPPYHLEDFRVDVYQLLLRRLTTHYPLMPYHQCVALSAVDWEAYVSVVARAALVHLATCVLRRHDDEGDDAAAAAASRPAASLDIASIAGVKQVDSAPPSSAAASQSTAAPATAAAPSALVVPFGFPEPRRSFTNDIVYHGDARIPPFPSLVRQYFTCATFLHLAAMRPNGWRSAMTPGMTPRVLATILAQPHIQQLMTALAAKDGATKADVEAQAKRILLLAGDTLNHAQCRTMGLMVREIFRRIYERVNVNHGAFERLHRQLQMPRVAIVFVPLHRSYIDFLILSFLLAEMQAPLPHVVAGDDFLSLGPIAALMRGSGAFFMRRSLRGDPLYAALFKEYVRQLTLTYHPVEFFIEGTRSRTGKTMAPKMGILKFVCDAFFDPVQQELDDVLFVPVSLSYDELLEAVMYAKELLGVPKPKETLSNFLKARSTLQRMHGSINLCMGDAVSLRSLKEHPLQCPLPYQPRNDLSGALGGPASPRLDARKPAQPSARSDVVAAAARAAPPSSAVVNTTPALVKLPSPTPPSILASVAWHLTYQLQRNIVITPASMVAALLECLSPYYSTRGPRVAARAIKRSSGSSPADSGLESSGDAAAAPSRFAVAAGVPLAEVEAGVMWLRGVLLERGARLSAEAATWSADRVVKTALGNLSRFAQLTHDMSAVAYQPDDVVTRLGVNISTNQLIHICVDEALVAVVAQAFGTATTPHQPPTAGAAAVRGVRTVKSEVLANQTGLLQRLLSTEFPNYAASSPISFTSWLECTVSRLQHSQPPPSQVKEGEAAVPPSVASHAGGALTHLPVTQYYYFLLQLICPHLEALFVVLTAALTLLKTFPEQSLGAVDVVTTTQRTCRTLYEEGKLNYAVTANKETLQHYFESLIALTLLRLDRIPPSPPAPGGKAKGSQGTVVYKVGALGQQVVLERLEVLMSQVHKLLWYPGAETESVVDTDVVKERLLSVYRQITQPAKM